MGVVYQVKYLASSWYFLWQPYFPFLEEVSRFVCIFIPVWYVNRYVCTCCVVGNYRIASNLESWGEGSRDHLLPSQTDELASDGRVHCRGTRAPSPCPRLASRARLGPTTISWDTWCLRKPRLDMDYCCCHTQASSYRTIGKQRKWMHAIRIIYTSRLYQV